MEPVPQPIVVSSSNSMATVHHVEYVDARQSTFIQAGRDQTTHHHHHHCHIYIFPRSSPLRHHIALDVREKPSLPIGDSEVLPQARRAAYSAHEALALVSAAVVLIDQITELLMDHRQSSSSYLDLALEFESLQRTLTLTRLVIHLYDNKPLGQGLVNSITPEVRRCVIILQDLLDSIDGAWLDFSITSVGGLCLRIRWARLLGVEFSSVRKKLCHSRQSFQGLLIALHSYVLLVFRFLPPLKSCLILS
jgi:hypothetical protein